MPKNPKSQPMNINPNLKSLKCNSKEKFGIAKDVKPDIATIIIEIGLTILALTAASPKTKAPTMLIVVLIGEGTRIPASCINSNAISIRTIYSSIVIGTDCLEFIIEKSNSVGINSS